MSRWLYIFAGFPGKLGKDGDAYLHAGGLTHCIEKVENLGDLEKDKTIQLRKEGVFRVGPSQQGEWLEDFNLVMSPTLKRDGITFGWFPENWSFGNRVTIHKTTANLEYRTVVHGTDLTEDQYLLINGPTADLVKERRHWRHEGWEKYEARWLPGACPQADHIVHLTWMVTTHALPSFAYNRLGGLIERGDGLKDPHRYGQDHYSKVRAWRDADAVPML